MDQSHCQGLRESEGRGEGKKEERIIISFYIIDITFEIETSYLDISKIHGVYNMNVFEVQVYSITG